MPQMSSMYWLFLMFLFFFVGSVFACLVYFNFKCCIIDHLPAGKSDACLLEF